MATQMLSIILITQQVMSKEQAQKEYDMYNPPPGIEDDPSYKEFQQAMADVTQKIHARASNPNPLNPHLTNPNTLDTLEKQAILDAHNYYRSRAALGDLPGPSGKQPEAANMNKLFWDPAIEKVARDYASDCYIEHNDDRQTDMLKPAVRSLASFTYPSSAPTSGSLGLGENIYYSSVSVPYFYGNYGVFDANVGWFNESYHWTYGKMYQTDDCDYICGHYTQGVWASTRYIGCAYSQCNNPTWDPSSFDKSWVGTFVVCNYWPPGNYYGQFPYEQGTACSNCDGDRLSCENGLCAGGMSSNFEASGGTDTNVDQCDNGLGVDECDWCCTNVAWQNRWKNKCATKTMQTNGRNQCEDLTAANGNNRCKWVPCREVGECNWDRGSKGSQNICKKLTDVTSCEAKSFCDWTYTNPTNTVIKEDIVYHDNEKEQFIAGDDEKDLLGSTDDFDYVIIGVTAFVTLLVILGYFVWRCIGRSDGKYGVSESEPLLNIVRN